MIDNFHEEYSFLSNFYPSEVKFDRVVYPTVEHAYQAAKTINITEQNIILKQETPGRAKRAGQNVHLREDWDYIRFAVMEDLVRQKFKNHVELKNKLIETNSNELVEGNTWGDTYWGVCRGVGENNLGLILMKVREELK